MPLEYSLVPDQQEGNLNSDSNSDSGSKSGSVSKSGFTFTLEAALLKEILTLVYKIILLLRKLTKHIIQQLSKPSGLLNIVLQ